MEQTKSKLSPTAKGLIAASCCFLILSLVYFFVIGRQYVSSENSDIVEEEVFYETMDYITDEDYEEMANEGWAE
ncbi:MAG: hypothetical protein J6V26_04195 [Alistipes sp.]|jgi:hypothetical protein|nr:hypothetical protein [Alistipes sp.]